MADWSYKIMAGYALSTQYPRMILTTADLEIGFSTDDGRLVLLRRRDGVNMIDHGEPFATLDAELDEAGVWLSGSHFSRYLGHELTEQGNALELTISVGLGPLRLLDHYLLSGPLIARHVTVENLDQTPVQLRSLRLLVPWVQVGTLQHCRFHVPGANVRAGVPLSVAAAYRRGILTQRMLLPGVRPEVLFEPVPVQSAGLLALRNNASQEALLCWYFNPEAPAVPEIDGNGQALTIGHQLQQAGWIRAGQSFEAGFQYLLVLQRAWEPALATLHQIWGGWGPEPGPEPASWLRDTPIYTLHPAQYGGFQGTAAILPQLRALGAEAICLLPVWQHANPSGELWDGNPARTGNPYAVQDLDLLDPTLGAMEDLVALVEAAHQQGLRVLVDLPVAGCATDARYLAEHPDWFCRDEYGNFIPLEGWSETYSFDLSRPDLQHFLRSWAIAQVRRYCLDGLWVSLARVRKPSWGLTGRAERVAWPALHGARMLRELQHDLKSISPELALIAEQQGPLYGVWADACCDYPAHTMFYNLALGRISATDLRAWLQDAGALLPEQRPRICFSESHETGTVNPLADGLRGSRISRALLAAMVFAGFVPMLWHGQEQGQELFIARLLSLRREQPALCYGETIYNAVSCSDPTLFALLRVYAGELLLCVICLSPQRQTYELRLAVDLLPDASGRYELRELLSAAGWSEDGRGVWNRSGLAILQLALDPFGAYCFAIRTHDQNGEQQLAELKESECGG